LKTQNQPNAAQQTTAAKHILVRAADKFKKFGSFPPAPSIPINQKLVEEDKDGVVKAAERMIRGFNPLNNKKKRTKMIMSRLFSLSIQTAKALFGTEMEVKGLFDFWSAVSW